MDKKFIITTSSETASLLVHAGFKIVYNNGNQWAFLNEPTKMMFSNLEDMTYTDMLLF